MMRTDEEYEALKAQFRDAVHRGQVTVLADHRRSSRRRAALAFARAVLIGVPFAATLGPWWGWLGGAVVALEELGAQR